MIWLVEIGEIPTCSLFPMSRFNMFADIEKYDDHGHRRELNETNLRFIMAKVKILSSH